MGDLYDSIVHQLRLRGWSRQDAEDYAWECVSALQPKRPKLTCGGIGVNYTVRDGRIVFS